MQISEVVQCEECGVEASDPVENVCGEWLGTIVVGDYGTQDGRYECPDILCRDCRETVEVHSLEYESEW